MYGLVLEGGGTKGAYHAGVYKAILEEGIEIKGITGTSVGALNAALIVQGDFDLCYNLWSDLNHSMLISMSDEEMERLGKLKLNREDLGVLADTLKTVLSDRGLDISPLKKMIEDHIDEDKLRNTNMDFGMVTISLTDLKPIEIFLEDIPYGEVNNYLIATSYLPIFKTERLGGKIYLDGAFYDNLPFGMLIEKGYKELILVRTNSRGIIRRIDKEELNVITISPSEDIGGALKFDQNTARRNLKLGYYDALRVFRNLIGDRYYIKPKDNKDYYFDMLLSLDKDQVSRISNLLKAPDLADTRVLFEYIVPKLGSILGLSKDFTYEDLIVSLLGKKSEQADIDRFQIYTFEELLDKVLCTPVSKEEIESLSTFDKFIEKVDIAILFNKDETLLEIADIIFCG